MADSRRPGYFTGSGLPMRFADENGVTLDIFQSVTQLPDETWGSTNIASAFQTLIDRSINQGFYGFLNANFHPPSYNSYRTAAETMMIYANNNGVPIWSGPGCLSSCARATRPAPKTSPGAGATS